MSRNFNENTVKKHAQIHSIYFTPSAPRPPSNRAPPTRVLNTDFFVYAHAPASRQLAIEIATAIAERDHTPPYRGGWPDDI